MTARPTIVTPAYATAITEATIDLADRVRTLTGKTAGDDSGRDLAAALASDFITALCRRGWRPTNAAAAARAPGRVGRPRGAHA